MSEHIEAVRLAAERFGRTEKAIEEFLPGWNLAPVVNALKALRGIVPHRCGDIRGGG